MAVDRTKILEAAQKHLSKGAYDKAIVELQKLVKADPSDVRTWLKIGDLYVKLNQRPQAIDTYARVADQYAGQGFFHKAVAVYKQILNLDQTRLDVKLKLAEMHESMQLTSDAMAAYEQVAGEYGRLGDADKALSTFGKMVALDPTNIPTRIKYAEALSRAGRNEEAAAAFEVGADLLKKQGRIDDYLKVVERLLFHREDVERSRELAELYLERNDGKRALAKLQVLFKTDPKHIPTLELLARAFEQVQQLPKTISVLREIARLYGDRGMVEERARSLQRIIALDPGDPEARQALAQLAGPARPAAAIKRDLAPPPGAVIEPSRAQRAGLSEPPEEIEPEDEPEDEPEADLDAGTTDGDDEVISYVDEDGDALAAGAESAEASSDAGESEDDVFIVEEDPVEAARDEGELSPFAEPSHFAGAPELVGAPEFAEPAQLAEPAQYAEPPPLRPSLPPDVAREANIAKLMTEVEVFLRYGLKQKVIEQLRAVLSIEPRHVEAREKLKDVLVERGEHAAAAEELVSLADLFVADKPAVALLYLRQARDLDPGNPEITARMSRFDLAPSRPPPAARAPTPAPSMPTPVPAAPAPAVSAARHVEPAPVAAPEPASPPTRPQPVTSYLARTKQAGTTGANQALDPTGKPAGTTGPNPAQPALPRPALGLGARGPARPLGSPSPLGSPLGAARPPGIAAPKPGAGKPFAAPQRSPRAEGEPRTGEIALPARPLATPLRQPASTSQAASTASTAQAAGPAPRQPTPAPRQPMPPPREPTPPPRQATPAPLAPDSSEEDGFFEDERTVFGGPIHEPPPDDQGSETADPFAVGADPFEPAYEPPVERAPIVPELPITADHPHPGDVGAFSSAPLTSPMVSSEPMAASSHARAGDPLAPISPEEFESAPLRPSGVDEQAPAPRPSLPPGEVEEILDEAEFFVAQGLFEEGVQVLRDALAAHPKNRLLADRISEIEEQAARASEAMKDASQPPPPIDNSFQLAEKLADELGQNTREGSDVLDVEEVFAQFKRGVEQQVPVDDTDTHFDLGIAYKEMGLIPDAIHEFELCLPNAARECMAHTMIGLCHLEKGDVAAAVGAFKKGLYAERKSEREELGLYYELGRAYEAMRDPQEALYYYEKVKKRDAKFLNVQDRIDALTKPTRAKTGEVAPNEDLDAAFDELMGKD